MFSNEIGRQWDVVWEQTHFRIVIYCQEIFAFGVLQC